jgi:ABC-type xylose transport system substrate-binding protein
MQQKAAQAASYDWRRENATQQMSAIASNKQQRVAAVMALYVPN